MSESAKQIQAQIDAVRERADPIVHTMSGRWVNLTGSVVHQSAWPIWLKECEDEPLRMKTNSGWWKVWCDPSSSGRFVFGMQWFGAIPGDAVRSTVQLQFRDESLLEFSCVDSCTEKELEILVWPGRERLATFAAAELASALYKLSQD